MEQQEGKDDYIGWYELSIEELFRYTWAMDTDYFFAIDCSLMIASKGGLNTNILNNMGIRSKKRYYNTLKHILEESNKPANSSGGKEMTENSIPTDFKFGG